MSFKVLTFTLVLFFSTITPSYVARTLFDIENPPSTVDTRTQPSITFLIQDVLANTTKPLTTSYTLNNQQHLPFSRPLPTYPPIYKAIPLVPQSNNPSENPFSTQTLEIPGFGISIPATSTLQDELEFGHVTTIEESMYVENGPYGHQLVGNAKGIYVAINSEDGNNGHMMAMTARFNKLGKKGEYKSDLSSLRLFGVHRRDVSECHVAVIGGTGKFKDANGYATISVVNKRHKGFSNDFEQSSQEAMELLLYNIYLS